MGQNNKTGILIADDNESLCKTLSFVLKHKGYDVAMAFDGPAAIDLLSARPFDVILLDIKMSPMDGVETYKKIKELRPEAVVIMMTAYAVEDLIAEVLKEGAYGIFYKPVDMDKVISTIEEAMGA